MVFYSSTGSDSYSDSDSISSLVDKLSHPPSGPSLPTADPLPTTASGPGPPPPSISPSQGRKCSNPDCRGLRKSVEFDIRLETEEDSRKEGYSRGGYLFELPMYHHKEMEAELKWMAPPNGKAVLVFRGKCGCTIGRFEVPGTKKPPPGKTKGQEWLGW